MSEQGGERDAWLIQPGESLKAYTAFEVYLRLGAARTLERVRSEIGKGSVPAAAVPSQRWIEEWSSRWRWVERARAWDEHEAHLRSQARERKVIEAEERIKDLSPEVVELLFEIASNEGALDSARVAASRDLLDRAQVGKRKQEDKIVATGEVAQALASILGRAALEPKPDGD